MRRDGSFCDMQWWTPHPLRRRSAAGGALPLREEGHFETVGR